VHSSIGPAEGPVSSPSGTQHGHVELFPFVSDPHLAGDGPRLVRAGSCLTPGL